MDAIGIFLKNEKEIEKAKELGFNIPEEEFIQLPMCFDLNALEAAFPNNRGHIIIYLKSNGSFEIDYDKELFEKIKNHLNSK